MEILTWAAHRKTIIQTQLVSVLSKVISDGIFNERLKKIKKNVGKIKNVKKRKKRALNKKRKKRSLHLCVQQYVSATFQRSPAPTGWCKKTRTARSMCWNSTHGNTSNVPECKCHKE